MSIATVLVPSAGLTRVIRPPVRSVTQSLSSGPQVISHGPSRPVVSTFISNCLVPATTESGVSWASGWTTPSAQATANGERGD